MGKIVRSTNELPKEFSIDKYRGMDKLNPFEWLCLLSNRLYIFTYAHYAIEENNYKELNSLNSTILDFFQNPFYVYDVTGGFTYIDDASTYIDRKKNEISVTDLSVFDFMLMSFEYKRANNLIDLDDNNFPINSSSIGFMNYYQEINKQYKEIDQQVYDEEEDFKGTINGRYPIMIDLYSNNDQLIDDFLVKVETLREKLNINPNDCVLVDSQTLQRWASYQLLAIMDLKIWSKINDFRITNTVLCVSVFPTGLYGESNLAKSIQPIINDFFNQDSYSRYERALNQYVASEIGKDGGKYFPENILNEIDREKYLRKIITKQFNK